MATFDTPLRAAVGEKTARGLADKLDLHTVGDLLHHYPRRYAERGEHTDLASLTVGEQVTILAQIQSVSTFETKTRDRKRLKVVKVKVGDGRNTVTITFFNLKRVQFLTRGRWGLFAGKVTRFKRELQLNWPDFQLFGVGDGDAAAGEIEEFAGSLIPVYPAAKDVPSWAIGGSVRVALDMVGEVDDPLPAALRARFRLVPLTVALRDIHRPETQETLGAARRRLKWDEAFALQLTLVQRKAAAARCPATARPAVGDGLLAAFDKRLPFALTDGQQSVGREITADLTAPHPMHRLLQGEVGSGKTIVALRAMLQVVDAGGQAVLLAPTEVLAMQHYRNLRELLGPLGRAGELDGAEEATRLALVTGSVGAKARREALHDIASGRAGIAVGTHALLYDEVEFTDLGLVVVDEQHRFGVEQRDALRAKAGRPPHVLVMTATPIPRTVAMTVFGDLETSSLTELPKGRSPISTHVVPAADKPHFLDRAWRRVREEVAKGHQVYVVCPRIGDGASGEDVDELTALEQDDEGRRAPLAVLDVAPLLTAGPLAELRTGVLHGRLPADEKDAVMRQFTGGGLDVLVATTVVEVGVDVPNASMMVIMDADRFGVSQLHQLRGRVGRGTAPGLCLLVTEAPDGTPARERLAAVASTLDGFRLAELDLEQRREGDVLGAAQSGSRSHVKLLSLLRDAKVIREARAEAIALIAADPDLAEHPGLAAAVAALVTDDRADYLEKG